MILLLLCSCLWSAGRLQAQVKNEKDSPAYRESLREMIPPNWYYEAPALLRVTLKKGTDFKQLSLDSATLETELEAIIRKGYSGIEIFATPHGGKSFSGLDALDRYRIDPDVGTMDDFRRLVRQAHRKGLTVVAFDNFGYCSVDAPHFIKACEDIAAGKTSRETKWFNWADSVNALPPMQPDKYYLGGSKHEEWVYSDIAKKYYWSKWEGKDKDGKPCALPQYEWSEEWQEEVKNITRFWMNTGIDGMVIDAVNWYTNYTWQIGKECIVDVMNEYGNVFMQPEGAGGFHEDPVPWITEGGWNCVQDYGLGIWWEEDNHLVNAIHNNDPSALETALQGYRDRVVAEGGVLYIGADAHFESESMYHLYVAFSIATGHLYCKSMGSEESWEIDSKLAELLTLQKKHPAFWQLGRRQRLWTNDDNKYYAFIQKATDNSERILCVFNFASSPQEITVDMSGLNAANLLGLRSREAIPLGKSFQVALPAYGYSFYTIENRKQEPAKALDKNSQMD